MAVIAVFEFRPYQIIIVFTRPFGRISRIGNFPRENEGMLLWTKQKKSIISTLKIDLRGFSVFISLEHKIFVNIGSVMEDDFDNKPKGHFPDLKRFIRSIQYIEGNQECFGEANGYCDREDCLWREYCLKK
ncbi:MAG: hypothetical protein OEV45_06310 [Desulfobacteraceae bacterium]|nr:hypothetical protein [Desulfobacteraceae bacterium]